MIDTSGWKEFRVGDYFHGIRGTSRKMQELNEGRTPVIAAARYNQGIAGFYDVPSEYENAITISCNGVGCGSTYYHDYPFAITGDAIVLKNISNVPQGALHYIASVYDAYFTRKYSYADKCSADKAEAERIKLPATSDGQPDWAYMESYMKQIMEESEKNLENLKKADNTKHLIDVSGWGKFRVGDLFDVSRPSSRSSQNYDEGNMPFVASGHFNNGVIAYLQPKDNNDYDEGGCITVSAVDGYAFYQKDKFLGRGGAGSSIMMLRDDNLNELNGKYICTLIRKACSDWEYSNMGNKDKLADTMIWLPITSTGEPDWQYMEDYMKAIMDKSEQIISDLQIGA